MFKGLDIVVSSPRKVAAMFWNQRWHACGAFVIAAAIRWLTPTGWASSLLDGAFQRVVHDASKTGLYFWALLGLLAVSLALQVIAERNKEAPGWVVGICHWAANKVVMSHIARAGAMVFAASVAVGIHGAVFGALFAVWLGVILCCLQSLTDFAATPRLS